MDADIGKWVPVVMYDIYLKLKQSFLDFRSGTWTVATYEMCLLFLQKFTSSFVMCCELVVICSVAVKLTYDRRYVTCLAYAISYMLQRQCCHSFFNSDAALLDEPLKIFIIRNGCSFKYFFIGKSWRIHLNRTMIMLTEKEKKKKSQKNLCKFPIFLNVHIQNSPLR